MGTDFGSIKDLMSSSEPGSAQSKLKTKIVELELDEVEEEVQRTAEQNGWGYINLKTAPLDADSVRALSLEEVRQLSAVALNSKQEPIKIACVDPNNKNLKEKLEQVFGGKKIEFFLISEVSLNEAVSFYEKLPKIVEHKRGVEVTSKLINKYKALADDFAQLSKLLSSVPISEVVSALISIALETGASDIHIEPGQQGIDIRLRIDGVLHEVAKLSLEIWPQLISRIKLISGLKLNVVGSPQDGRFTIELPQDTVDVRVSLLPVEMGESVVMRLLLSSAVGLKFEDLGFTGIAHEKVSKEVSRPNGMIITCGPTGSGKTTTLYAILNKLNSPENKIITLEDPIEYRLQGVNQSQIDAKTGYTFANGLRSILRQDPDIVMVGEMRDEETVDVAINAALTGHLLLSTLHTNQALESIPRFLALAAKPFLLAPALNCVIGQRLVRRLCECREEDNLNEEIFSMVKNLLASIPEKAGAHLPLELKFYKPKGCQKCKGIGYKGRVGIYEVLEMSKELEEAIFAQKVSMSDMEKIAQSQGMVKMVQDGLLKALEGITSVEEVFRVTE